MINSDDYFSTARERYRITLKRRAKEPGPWTEVPELRDWHLCSVHREDDRVTRWFRNNIRQPLTDGYRKGTHGYLDVVKATIAFRWFNRIETATVIWDMLLAPQRFDFAEAHRRLRDVRPIVSGAYIILGEQGYDKLTGVLRCVERAFDAVERTSVLPDSLELAWRKFTEIPYMGGFMAYEVVSDLRWTHVLEGAEDIMTWANAGPGCARGLGWVVRNDPKAFHHRASQQKVMLLIMRELLAISREDVMWPSRRVGWQPWEMREVEHWLCEYDKIRRARNGERLKRRYRPREQR